ncbi:MAG: alpha/beta hydrolase [Gammaproteobacteria bacterium]|nr:alpha/beta hydrolase [Gammaproteobacteria bacterium]
MANPTDRRRFMGRPASVERQFVRLNYGQLHFRRAEPRAAAELSKPPVILFHQSPNSSQVFVEFMAELGADRLVIAPDTPGFGDSDLPAEQPDIAFYAKVMAELVAALGFTKVQLVGYHTGAAIAIELARTYPDLVRALVLVGIPVFNETEQAAFRAIPWPTPRTEDGSHLATEWSRSMQWRGPGQTEDSVVRTFNEKLGAGQTAWWGAHAAIHYDTLSGLKALRVPVLFIRPRDDLWETSLRALPALGDAQRIDLPDFGFGLFEVVPELIAGTIRVFLDENTKD